MIKKFILILSLFIFLLSNNKFFITCHKMHYISEDILDPQLLKPYMFTHQITGNLNILLPKTQNINLNGQLISQQYIIQMKKIKQQLLPIELFNKTTMYVYAGQTVNNGYVESFPGPAVIAKRNVKVKITWRNMIDGKHILPVDYNYPFMANDMFKNQVPTVPHVHGVATLSASDGEPEAYWTKTGAKGQMFKSVRKPINPNQAVFEYPNEQQASNNWYHDHTMGITRLNVYAGLAGFYKIVDPQNLQENKILQKYGTQVSEDETKYLIINDKTFRTNGELFYPNNTDNPNFSSWVPEFYGNTILVNGVIWPKMTLTKGKYRFVLLNACQNRFLNIYFQNQNKRIPIQLIRVDGDYYDRQIVVTQLLATISSRFQFILDLTSVKGEVILKNDAQAPYPEGEADNLNPQFTGQLMKIFVQGTNLLSSMNQIKVKPIKNIQTTKKSQKISYPTFTQGQKVFTTLFQVIQDQQVSAMFIDGVSMINGRSCENSTYQIGKTYDFYMINLSPDSHPMHFHLINVQKVKQFKFDVGSYEEKYFEINGGVPTRHGFVRHPVSLDPQPFRAGEDEYPMPFERVFRDTVDCHPEYVTVLRVKFAQNDGSNFNSLDLKGQRFVFHCHMLQHEDNQMMKYFCLK